MSDLNTWQQSNARQLGAALAECRQRLERFAERPAVTPQPDPSQTPLAPAASAWTVRDSLIKRLLGEPAPPPTRAATASPSGSPPAAGVSPSPADVETNSAAEPPSALDELADRLRLSAFERNVLLLCAAMELDTRTAGWCACAQDNLQKSFPTFALALALFDEPSWDALSPERPLRYWRLIEINQPRAEPLTSSALRADERIVSYLKGLNYLDDRLSPFLAPLELESGSRDIAPSQREVVEIILRRLDQAVGTGPVPVVQLVGPDPISKQLIAIHVAAEYGRHLYRLAVELLPSAPAELETLSRLWQRESRLLPLALYLDAQDLDSAAAERLGALSRFLTRSDGVFFLGIREVLPRLGRSHVALDIAKPTVAEQHATWEAALGQDAAASSTALAAQFNLNLPTIQQLTELAQSEAKDVPGSLADKVWDVCCASERPRLDALAQRLEPKMTWEDLVLPEAEMNQLRQIAAQVRQRRRVYDDWGFARKMNRGFGITALFAGDSGTGKTMAAEVIANDLRLNLYRIDLSAVVNKYIGETEKNLRRLFDAAEDGGVILFFDEADALFGKRSEVKDSHDRYANIEVNYLLQRMESYRGLAILATNMKSALDSAFLRRLRFVVNFPYPGLADRRRLWQKVFRQSDGERGLPAPPLDGLDYDRLARLNLTGGHILNAAINAAFLAAQAGTPVTMRLVLDAAKAEFLKLERPINEAEFRWAELPASRPTSEVISQEPVLV